MNTKTFTPKFKKVTHVTSELDQKEQEDILPEPQPVPKRRPKYVLRVEDTKQIYHEEQLNLAIQLRRGLVEGTECRKLIDIIVLRLADQNEALLAEQKVRASLG